MKVALDTNVLVSAVATRGLCADVLHATLAEHQLVVGETVLAELRRVLGQKIGAPAAAIEELDSFLRQVAIVLDTAAPLPIAIRDRADAAVLAEAVAGEAEVLVTGDRDLLDIASKAPLPIVTPRGFWELLRSPPNSDG